MIGHTVHYRFPGVAAVRGVGRHGMADAEGRGASRVRSRGRRSRSIRVSRTRTRISRIRLESARPSSRAHAARARPRACRWRDVRPSPLRRLGRGTSGVVLFARTEDALRQLTRTFAERSITKIYRALVQSVGLPAEQTVDVPIGRVGTRRRVSSMPRDRMARRHAACFGWCKKIVCDVSLSSRCASSPAVLTRSAFTPPRSAILWSAILYMCRAAARRRCTPERTRRCPATAGITCTRCGSRSGLRQQETRWRSSRRRRKLCGRPRSSPPASADLGASRADGASRDRARPA